MILPVRSATVAVMMSLQNNDRPWAVRGNVSEIGISIERDRLCRKACSEGLDVTRGNIEGCDLVTTASPEALAAVVYGGAPFELIRIEGDLALAKRFVTLFPLPPKAPS